ncbi:hypothetical protein A5646_21700 [Mycobacterium sp. 1245499.0]|uniref:hypothetical protein n=1 Tax=unclassified Mycobacterium TaxID=2642494 RepID=UPI0007FEC833|nr:MULTISPECIES: hypothetical protein [unclassified Mycobacterium]OBJ19254.1 hypothetical protein A5622_20800 [Mycobacterium sp. 1245801.1]OBK09203.1 hypothetical protein A9W96_12210 [Mycobacterium sp. 1245852.3]OBK99466.1 hypothetical protein A5646_21700 [Mycobacterium sp. 1245499.0]
MRIITTIAAGTLLAGSLGGAAVAHADSPEEQQACQLLDDPAAAQQGLAPAEYTFMQLRATMSAQRARDIMSIAVQEDCPNHIVDLPASWR